MEKNLNSGSSRVLVGALADNLAGLPAAKEINLSDFSLFLSVMKNKDAHTSVLSIIMGEPKL